MEQVPQCFGQLYVSGAPECQICSFNVTCCQASELVKPEQMDLQLAAPPHSTQMCVEEALQRGEFTCRELVGIVREKLNIKGTTVPDILNRLKLKGVVEVQTRGKQFYYKWRF